MVLWAVAALCVGGIAVVAAYVITPWPRALLLRSAYDQDSEKAAQTLAPLVPTGVAAILDQPYDPSDGSLALDVYFPGGAPQPRTTVVWVHGGGWLAGSKAMIGNYARILAGRGVTVVAVGYTRAPRATYPTPVRQVNTALGYLVKNAARLQVDPSRLVLAGDSSGAQVALQLAALTVQPDYAQLVGIAPALRRDQLAGLLLYCGIYRLQPDYAESYGMITELWSYSGTRGFMTDPCFALAWVLDRINRDFPPAFISVGNDDGLWRHSIDLADALEKNGVRVDRLIFPADHEPRLEHEYQYDLAQPDARLALDRSAAFLSSLGR